MTRSVCLCVFGIAPGNCAVCCDCFDLVLCSRLGMHSIALLLFSNTYHPCFFFILSNTMNCHPHKMQNVADNTGKDLCFPSHYLLFAFKMYVNLTQHFISHAMPQPFQLSHCWYLSLVTPEDYRGPSNAGYFKWVPDEETGQLKPVTRLKEINIEKRTRG